MNHDSSDAEMVKALLDSGAGEAEALIGDPSKLDALLTQLEQKLKETPALGAALSEIPLMISMVKSYAAREYSEASPQVMASIVSALLYVVKKDDLIPDNIPAAGMVDDIAVVTLALKFVEPELRAYAAWRDGGKGTEA